MILFFSTVCSSFKRFKCVIQKLEDPENSWKFVRPKKIAEILRNPEKQLKNLPTQKNRIWPNFKPKRNRTGIPFKILTCAPPPPGENVLHLNCISHLKYRLAKTQNFNLNFPYVYMHHFWLYVTLINMWSYLSPIDLSGSVFSQSIFH